MVQCVGMYKFNVWCTKSDILAYFYALNTFIEIIIIIIFVQCYSAMSVFTALSNSQSGADLLHPCSIGFIPVTECT